VTQLLITRAVNACVLLQFGQDAVLTDPCLDAPPLLRFNEPIGLNADALPPLAAIVGGHGVPDHWRPQSLRAVADKGTVACLVATERMRQGAVREGFRRSRLAQVRGGVSMASIRPPEPGQDMVVCV